jgi:DNA polymerase III epsilon subunit-like protein
VILLVSIYNAKCRFLILDIETTKEEGRVFDIAFSVYSRKEGEIGSMGYIVKEHQNYIPWYADRLQRYQQYITEGKYQIRPFSEVMEIIQKIILKYELEYATAYNSGLDFSIIEKTCNHYNTRNPLQTLKELDLYNMACQTLGKQKYFKNFTERNNLKTEKGNTKANAETMFQYLISNPDFVEEHTGLSDIKIEAQILERVLRQKKKMNTDRNRKAWLIVQG